MWPVRSSPLFPVHLMQHHEHSQGLFLWMNASPPGIANSKLSWEEDIKCVISVTRCVMIPKLLCFGLRRVPQPLLHLNKRPSKKPSCGRLCTPGKNWWDCVIVVIALGWKVWALTGGGEHCPGQDGSCFSQRSSTYVSPTLRQRQLNKFKWRKEGLWKYK